MEKMCNDMNTNLFCFSFLWCLCNYEAFASLASVIFVATLVDLSKEPKWWFYHSYVLFFPIRKCPDFKKLLVFHWWCHERKQGDDCVLSQFISLYWSNNIHCILIVKRSSWMCIFLSNFSLVVHSKILVNQLNKGTLDSYLRRQIDSHSKAYYLSHVGLDFFYFHLGKYPKGKVFSIFISLIFICIAFASLKMLISS